MAAKTFVSRIKNQQLLMTLIIAGITSPAYPLIELQGSQEIQQATDWRKITNDKNDDEAHGKREKEESFEANTAVQFKISTERIDQINQ